MGNLLAQKEKPTRVHLLAAVGAALLFAMSLMFTGTAGAAPNAADKPAPTAGEASAPDVTPLTCTHAHSNKDLRANARLFTADSVNQRRGPHTSCTSDGHGSLSHTVDYHCWTSGDSVTRNGLVFTTWTYLRNVTTGVSGWVSDAYLAKNSNGSYGSTVAC